MHWLDQLLAAGMRPRMFSEGWGDLDVLRAGATRGWELAPVPRPIEIAWDAAAQGKLGVRDGGFESPHASSLPPASRIARVRSVGSPSAERAVVLLAASGEEGFAWRERLIGPLCDSGVRAVILENPLYGERRPPGQSGADLRTVSDLVTMNRASIEEGRALVHWLRAQGHPVVGIAGFSLGGHMAALAASHLDEPTPVAALATGRSPALIYTRGALSHAICWDALVRPGEVHEQAKARLREFFLPGDLDRVRPPTHLRSAIIVSCEGDGYVSPEESRALHRHWPGAELRTIASGHASSFVFRRSELRRAVRDALLRLDPSSPRRPAEVRQAPTAPPPTGSHSASAPQALGTKP